MTTAIYGGSFDPIHKGHIAVARYVASLPGIDRVCLMVSRRNPLKPEATHASDADRLAMASLACRDVEGVEVSDFEMHLPSPSYTIDTLTALSSAYPGEHFKMVIGADNWAAIDKWREPETILSRYGLIVYPRPGYRVSEEREGMIYLPQAPLIEVSSSMIREYLSQGLSIQGMVSPLVEKYISDNKIYSE